MLNFGRVINTVQRNCHISDSQYAGNYTMCVFLLKMREYYRWEHEISFAHALPRNEVGSWLVEREQAWERIENDDFADLPLETGSVDPFDNERANNELIPHGYVYSAGYGLFNKPLFFLGHLNRQEHRDGVNVLVSTCEYARDLVAPPAMALGDTVFVRQDAMRRFIWEKLEEWRWNKRDDVPMARAARCYDPGIDAEALLDLMTENETESAILHEVGEVKAGELVGDTWEEMLSSFPRCKAEFVARAVRDHLADCLSTLPALIEADNEAALHFYFANLTGLRKELFPTAMEAYRHYASSGDVKPLMDVAQRGQDHWHGVATSIVEDFRNKGDRARPAIESVLCRGTL
jgi:hypothetical protein